jgi:hypothetical protein
VALYFAAHEYDGALCVFVCVCVYSVSTCTDTKLHYATLRYTTPNYTTPRHTILHMTHYTTLHVPLTFLNVLLQSARMIASRVRGSSLPCLSLYVCVAKRNERALHLYPSTHTHTHTHTHTYSSNDEFLTQSAHNGELT